MEKLNTPAILLALVLIGFTASAQNADSLLNRLAPTDSSLKTLATFKSTHVVLSHSSQTEKKYDLSLRIRHHFGDIGGSFGGSHSLFGLDGATDLFIGLDYGITNRLTVGAGRSRANELYNFLLKYKLIEQTVAKGSPVTLTLLAQTGWITRKPNSPNEFGSYSDRFSHLLQAIVARKFTPSLSLEVLPTYLIRSKAADPLDHNNLFTLGVAGRLKIMTRFSLIADYQLVNAFGRPSNLSSTYYNPLGVGLEIETGGHIFSLDFMNSEYIVENNFLPNTQKSWQHGGVRFGFTISRNFTLHKSKNKEIESRID